MDNVKRLKPFWMTLLIAMLVMLVSTILSVVTDLVFFTYITIISGIVMILGLFFYIFLVIRLTFGARNKSMRQDREEKEKW